MHRHNFLSVKNFPNYKVSHKKSKGRTLGKMEILHKKLMRKRIWGDSNG